MKKRLTHIPLVNEDQVAFAAQLGLDVRGCTTGVALARIEDALAVGFHGVEDLRRPSVKQVDLAGKFGYDISSASRREGSAVIDDIMTELNLETVENEGLAPGVAVRNIRDTTGRQLIVSSVQPDGTVYFRGGNGKRAWARSLRRISSQPAGENGTASPAGHPRPR